MRSVVVAALATLLITSAVAFAQSSGSNLERFNRQQQLQQYELDTRMQANEDIPPSQRLLLDYGGYFSPQYFSIDDSSK